MLSDWERNEKKDELKWFFHKLGEAINDTVNHSEEVQDILNQIKKFGLRVDISMIIGLGIYNSFPDKDVKNKEGNDHLEKSIRFELTTDDRAFLALNKIVLNLESSD